MKKTITVFITLIMLFGMSIPASAESLTCWFPPEWKTEGSKAAAITDALSRTAGITINPRIAKDYPEILTAFASNEQALAYVGSFVQALIHARKLGTPLVQSVNGKELYAGVLIYPQGTDPNAILSGTPEQIAYAVGASSGESSAKAATDGKAAIKVANHAAAAGAVNAGKAKAAVVKNWWWESHKQEFPGLAVYNIPGISVKANPDNVLTASTAVPADVAKKIANAAIALKDIFGAAEVVRFDMKRLQFPLDLMKKGKIDPLTYQW